MNLNRSGNERNAKRLTVIAGLALALSACVASTEPEGDSSEAATSTTTGVGHWNLSGWQLQLPTGTTDNPQTVSNPTSFKDAYFYVDTDGSLTFMDPRTGVTTSGSQHPRSELRELTSGWAGSGTNTLTATVAVTKVPSTVTIGQIFQSPNAPSKPLAELQYKAGGEVSLFIEQTNQGGNGKSHPVASVKDGAKFDYVLALTKNEIAVTINGKETTFSLPSSFDGEKFYFKWGDYDQTATSGKVTTTAGTIVKFYEVAVSHK